MQSTVAFSLLGSVFAQQPGHQKEEFHPPMDLQVCTNSGGCNTESNSIVLDANWRWVHKLDDYQNCYDDAQDPQWIPQYCPDSESCVTNCAIEGVEEQEWKSIYGVEASNSGPKLQLVTKSQDTGMTNVGSRFYMLDGSTDKYRTFKLKNKEFTFDADVSQLGCGLNGALYFVEMDADGAMANSDKGLNRAGAAYGTGYCDAQCANDIKFIKGVANIQEWNQAAANGTYGSCCAEMDIWEANSMSTQITPHPCSFEGAVRCEGEDCGMVEHGDVRDKCVCDMSGCDSNPYRLGDTKFFGVGSDFAVDSSKPMTVVTQFITDDGTDDGDLTEIKRFYIQDGKKIENAMSSLDGLDAYNSLKPEHCDAQAEFFGDTNNFQKNGGFKAMGDAMGRGMVLVMSLWDDHAVNMLWLDSKYPTDGTGPGVARGPCSIDSGNPDDVEKDSPDAWTSFTNVKIGEIGSTTPSGPTPAPTPTPSPSPTPSPTPSPSGCPGGSLSACIDLCPADIFAACAESCSKRCPHAALV